MDSPNGLGILIGVCFALALLLTAPIWVAFLAIVYAVLETLF
jgi:hypothetical protein